jgi:hypothetical protein
MKCVNQNVHNRSSVRSRCRPIVSPVMEIEGVFWTNGVHSALMWVHSNISKCAQFEPSVELRSVQIIRESPPVQSSSRCHLSTSCHLQTPWNLISDSRFSEPRTATMNSKYVFCTHVNKRHATAVAKHMGTIMADRRTLIREDWNVTTPLRWELQLKRTGLAKKKSTTPTCVHNFKDVWRTLRPVSEYSTYQGNHK